MMRREKKYSLERQQFEHPQLTYRDKNGLHSVEILAGQTDNIEVFKEGNVTYVLSWNPRKQYAGMEAFMGHDKVGEVFIQNQGKLEKLLGKGWLELNQTTIAKKLLYYITWTLPASIPGSEIPVPPAESRQSESKTFEIHLEDLKEEAQKRYLEIVKGEPIYGPLAILEIEPTEEENG